MRTCRPVPAVLGRAACFPWPLAGARWVGSGVATAGGPEAKKQTDLILSRKPVLAALVRWLAPDFSPNVFSTRLGALLCGPNLSKLKSQK